MKKFVAIVLAFVMMLSFVPHGIMATANAVSNNNFEVSVFWYDFADAYLSQVREALDEDLVEAGFTFINYDAARSQATQNDQIDIAIAQGTDLLIVNIVDTGAIDASQKIVNKAKAAGLPIIFFNREVDDYVLNSYKNACFVGIRAAEAGEKQGIMAGNYIVENYDAVDLNNDGNISYIMMKGELGHPEAEARTSESVRFANDILNEAGKPSLKYYDSRNTDRFQPANWSKVTAFDFMETALSTHPMNGNAPVEVVFANCDDMALGCIEALNNADWNTGSGKSIPVFGVDCTRDAVEAIKDNKMTGTILQSFEGLADTVTTLAKNAANGKNVFDGAEDMFNVDNRSAKVRVPYEIVMKDTDNYPEYPSYPIYPDYPETSDFHASVFWYDFSDAFLYDVRNSLDEQLTSWGISNFTNFDAAGNQAIQNDQIDDAIAQGTDILIVNIVDAADITAALKIVNKAKAAWIPVIFFNREVPDVVLKTYSEACYVGTNEAEAGELQGMMAGQYIVDNYGEIDINNDGTISYIMMKGELGNPVADMRTQYSVENANMVLEAHGYPTLKYYDPNIADRFQPSNWSRLTAYEFMKMALTTNPYEKSKRNTPVEVVFANNDDMALGCIEALNNIGFNLGGATIPVFGIDGTDEAFNAIFNNRMTGTVYMSPVEIAFTIAWLADNAQIGLPVFNGAENAFNVDDGIDKVRVPYTYFSYDDSYYPDYPEAPEFPSMIKGDVNGDYTVSNADLILTARYIVELEDDLPRAVNADINNDGIITNSDLIEIALIIISANEPVDVIAGVFWYDFSDAFLSTVRDALDEDLFKAGINFTNYDAACSQRTQNDQIDAALSQGANLLIVNIVDTASIDAQLAIANKAKSVGVPVIFFNREVADDVINSYANACFVGTRAAEAGEMQGQMAGEYIVANYDAIDLNKDGKISYIMMKGELGNPEAEARTEYSVEFANDILNAAGKPDLVYYDRNNTDKFQPSNWSKTTAFELMETALSTNPMDSKNPIEVVFANNDDAALGCIEALNNAGWNKGYGGKSIPVFGIDYTADARIAIDTGKMTGSILQSANGIAYTINALVSNVADGKHVFADAEDNFNVDRGAAKIRVPYEIKA